MPSVDHARLPNELGNVNKVRTKRIYQTGIRRIYHYFLDLYNSGKSERIEWEHMRSNHKNPP